jgi:hypothetical protein
VPYFHLVYTLPAELRDLAYQNKALVYGLLMKAAAETTLEIAANPRHLGARLGLTAVLHSWGSAMTHHPHVHMIVPGGGLAKDGARWVSAGSGFLVHVNALARLFRGKMLAMLTEAHAQGRLLLLGHRPRCLRRAYRWPASEKPSQKRTTGSVDPNAAGTVHCTSAFGVSADAHVAPGPLIGLVTHRHGRRGRKNPIPRRFRTSPSERMPTARRIMTQSGRQR